ncbi:unnamed protein product, partial [Rotaria sp. Silwood1]
MSATSIDQVHAGENLPQHQSLSEAHDNPFTLCDANDAYEKRLRYNKLVTNGTIAQYDIEGDNKLILTLYKLEDADLHIIIEQINSKEHPVRVLEVRPMDISNELVEPGFIELTKSIEYCKTFNK